MGRADSSLLGLTRLCIRSRIQAEGDALLRKSSAHRRRAFRDLRRPCPSPRSVSHRHSGGIDHRLQPRRRLERRRATRVHALARPALPIAARPSGHRRGDGDAQSRDGRQCRQGDLSDSKPGDSQCWCLDHTRSNQAGLRSRYLRRPELPHEQHRRRRERHRVP